MARNSDADSASPDEVVVARARAWIGTPYRHQASCRGAGTDCLGLVRGLWRELLGVEPERPPAYTPDWSETGQTEDLLLAARRHLDPVELAERRSGDVLVLRMADIAVAKHVGVLARSAAGHETLIHAYCGHGVVESPLTPAWSRRVVGAFRFPLERD
ncbi:MAG: C40 family peptidase [Amaricoccus sp.]|nr:C40 family peptidase [Amaricoccus sp.]